MKKFLPAILLLCFLPSLASAQMLIQKRFKLDWQAGEIIEKKDAAGNVIETNRPLGYRAYEESPSPGMINEVKPETTTTYTTPLYTGTEGANVCFAVSAFNTGIKTLPSGDIVPADQESAKSNIACAQMALPAPTKLPFTFRGAPPHYTVVEVPIGIPEDAHKAFITLQAFDADDATEGELWINDQGPIILFPGATSAGNQVATSYQLEVPLARLIDGVNKFVFVHKKGAQTNITLEWGINSIAVTFQLPKPPPAPTGLKVSMASNLTAAVSRRAGDTASGIGVLVNKDQVLGPTGMVIEYPTGYRLDISRRAGNTSSVVAFLVNKNMPVEINGQQQ